MADYELLLIFSSALADYERFTLLCFEGCYEIRGNHGTLGISRPWVCYCVSIHRFVLAVSVPCSPPFPRGSCPFPECSRNVPPRYIGVRDPVYRCLGPGLSFDADPLRGVPGVFPECSPPLINGVPVKRCLGPEPSEVPSDPPWVCQEVFGTLPVTRCSGPDPLINGLEVILFPAMGPSYQLGGPINP